MFSRTEGPEDELIGALHAGIAIAVAVVLGLRDAPTWAIVLSGLGTFAALMLCLLHRKTIWVAAILGTALAGAVPGAIGYFFFQVIGAVVGGLIGATIAAAAYARVIRSVRTTGGPT